MSFKAERLECGIFGFHPMKRFPFVGFGCKPAAIAFCRFDGESGSIFVTAIVARSCLSPRPSFITAIMFLISFIGTSLSPCELGFGFGI